MGLNATVTPGLTVTSSTVLSAANLNLLGTPTISITGSIDSSDIGADTIGTSEIQANAVTQAEIGNIGQANYILIGDSSGNGTGTDTLAVDGSTNKISLLVNDTSTLKARYITGSLDVTADTATNTLGLTIKDDIVTSGMIQDSAFSGRIRVGDIQPGGGVGNGGVASQSDAAKTGGILVFDPAVQEAIDGVNHYGKATVLQPSAQGQVLTATNSKGGLAFSAVTGQAKAIVNAYLNTYVDDHAEATQNFVILNQYNVSSLKLNGLKGQVRVYFASGLFENGNVVQAMGYGLSDNDPDSHVQLAASLTTVATEAIDGTDYQYIDVVFIHAKNFNGHPNSNSGVRITPNMVQLHFYT